MSDRKNMKFPHCVCYPFDLTFFSFSKIDRIDFMNFSYKKLCAYPIRLDKNFHFLKIAKIITPRKEEFT